MTGFGSAVCKAENVSVAVELKAVNNRYFKLSLRMTDGFSALEQRVEPLIRRVVERGSINAHVRIVGTRNDTGYRINTAVLQSYVKQLSDAAAAIGRAGYIPLWDKYFGRTDYLTPLDRLTILPGVITPENDDADTNSEAENEIIGTMLERALREALGVLHTMRKIEGESMAKDLTTNVESLRLLIDKITELAPRIAPHYRQRLKERIEKAMAEQGHSLGDAGIGDADFVRELAVYADRCDISEELVRFQSHLEQFTAAMLSKESCGRKLDFLTQELFREVNTIGSKANDADITKYVVEIKTIIERIREMVQNIE